MDVAVSALRAELASWINEVRDGEEVVVTDRGTPVARLVPIDAAPLLDRLTRDGVIGRPRQPERPRATDAPRVSARHATSHTGSVADLIDVQRR